MRRLLFLVLLLFFCSLGGCSVSESPRTPAGTHLQGDGLVVLCYHRVLPSWALHWGRLFWRSNELSRYAISRREFAQQLDYLRQVGVRFVTPQEAEDYLAGRIHLPGKLVLVTFDDGDLSVYRHAFPVLKKRKIPFLFFVIAGQVGRKWEGFSMCSWEQIKEMVASGLCVVGLHTYDLHYWDSQAKKPVFLLPGRERLFAEDTARGTACLKEHLGLKTRYFAYPYGFGTPTTDEILRTQGFSLVFTLRAKVNRPGDAPFVGRVLVTPDSWPQVAAWAQASP
ncbi:polysaccharide deacetylase [Ammonifex degensii KC4]|uniref:Polysaccharide deacetylase n=1 Tax=Ammonifex degensii (strain DSM 10501 / KC4) TaxID=429009 RepID=C9RCK9_AMMDK|nr:polysaccharide deacetylase [Ammonifex degensii KC4]